jgi:hypothetical protein
MPLRLRRSTPIWERWNNAHNILPDILMSIPANCRHLRQRSIYASRSSLFIRVEIAKAVGRELFVLALFAIDVES